LVKLAGAGATAGEEASLFGPVRRLVMMALAAVVVLAVAGGAGWWFFIRSDNSLATSAPAIPQELKSTGTAPAATSTGGGNAYKIVSDSSEAAYFVDEKLVKLPLPSTAKGSTKAIQGEFYLTGEGLDPAKPSKFTVDLTTLKSDEPQRDGQVQRAGLQTSRFPTATFTATKLSGFPAQFAAGQEVPMQLTGTMDLHGVQKEITWDVKAKKEGDVFSVLATVTFKFADFNIPQLNIGGIVAVQDHVTLQVQIIAQPG